MAENTMMELAWPKGDIPEKCQRYDLSPDFSKEVLKIISILKDLSTCRIYSAVPKKDKLISGRYFVFSDQGNFFLRISSRIGKPLLEKKITDHLLSRGVFVNPILHTKILKINNQILRVDIRPYIEPSFFDNTNHDLELMGSEMKKLHLAFKDLPFNGRIFKNTVRRYNRLEKVKENLFQQTISGFEALSDFGDKGELYRSWFQENTGFISEACADFDSKLYLKKDALTLHGEIHPANVIFKRIENRALFIDFEESVHTFAPPSWDIAYLVLRFIMGDNPDYDFYKRRLKCFEDSYGGFSEDWFIYMKKTIAFSIMIVFDLILNGVNLPLSELDKFLKLHYKIKTYER